MTRSPTRRSRTPLRAILCCLLLSVVASSAWGAPTAAQSTDAAELLRRSAETMAGLASFHFELTTPRGETLFMENFELAGLEGDVQRPDRFQASATAKAAIIELTVQVVGVGTRLWVTDPLSQEERFVEFSTDEVTGGEGAALVDLLNPDRVLLRAVELIDQPIVAGEDEIDGVATTRIEGTFDLARVQQDGTPVPGLATAGPLPVAIWLDETGRVRRLQLLGPLTDAESPDVLRQLDLSAFDEPVDIQPPDESGQ